MKRRTEREHLFTTLLRVVIAPLMGSFLKPDLPTDSKDKIV